MNFRKLLIPVLFFILILILSCNKGVEPSSPCQEKTPASELPTMTKYASDNGMNVTVDPSGLLYEIVAPGTGVTPTATSTVTVKYTGKLLSGATFDSNQSGVGFVLNQLIMGWQIGIPKIKPGGKIKMIVPSSLAYGCSTYSPALKGQILYFEVELVTVS